jgi:hypothetical protein
MTGRRTFMRNVPHRSRMCGAGTVLNILLRIVFMQDDRDTVAQWH